MDQPLADLAARPRQSSPVRHGGVPRAGALRLVESVDVARTPRSFDPIVCALWAMAATISLGWLLVLVFAAKYVLT